MFCYIFFIHGSYIDPKICDALIEEHKKSPDVKDGIINRDEVNIKIKESKDLTCSPYPNGSPFTDYLNALQKVVNEKHRAEHSQDPQGDTYDDTETGTSVED